MDEGYAKVLRKDADQFVMTVAVIAEQENRSATEVAMRALADAAARLQENGMIGDGTDDDA